jgi:hypothetical protein
MNMEAQEVPGSAAETVWTPHGLPLPPRWCVLVTHLVGDAKGGMGAVVSGMHGAIGLRYRPGAYPGAAAAKTMPSPHRPGGPGPRGFRCQTAAKQCRCGNGWSGMGCGASDRRPKAGSATHGGFQTFPRCATFEPPTRREALDWTTCPVQPAGVLPRTDSGTFGVQASACVGAASEQSRRQPGG